MSKRRTALGVANGCDCRYPFDNSNCADCGLDTIEAGEWYGVHDEIWLQAWDHISRLPGQQILCIGCLEKRIGRRLTPRDFTDVPANDPHRDSFVSDRMFERLVFPDRSAWLEARRVTKNNVATLPPRDPVFALVPELRLHLSEMDGQLVTNSREVSRVFGTKHPRLLRKLARCIEVGERKGSGSWYRQRTDGTVDMTSEGLMLVIGGARIGARAKQFIFDWIDLFGDRARKYEARTGRSVDAMIAKAIGVPFHYFTPGGRQCCDDCRLAKDGGPILHDAIWRSIAANDPDHTFLCFECTEKRLGRGLTQADLKVCPFNAGWIAFDGADVAAPQFARGRRLLPGARE